MKQISKLRDKFFLILNIIPLNIEMILTIVLVIFSIWILHNKLILNNRATKNEIKTIYLNKFYIRMSKF